MTKNETLQTQFSVNEIIDTNTFENVLVENLFEISEMFGINILKSSDNFH